MKVLIVEDDKRISDIVSLNLKIRWPDVVVNSCRNGREGILLADEIDPDLIILDLGLPDIDGLEVIKQIRNYSKTPILILSVRDEEADIVEGLETGADEYITKPFRQMELLSRIQCLLRRNQGESYKAPLIMGPFHLLVTERRLKYHGKNVALTMTETRILEQLMRHRGNVVPIELLAQTIWGDEYPGSNEAIHVYIRRLRQKIELDPSHPQAIINLPGVGYKLIAV